jgi:regulator of replication initiation timing
MNLRCSPNPVGGSTSKNQVVRVDVAELAEQVREMHDEVKALVIALEKIRHRLDRVEHQLANPE